MKKPIIIFIIFLCLVSLLFAYNGFEGRPIIHNIGMPTGYILNRGETIIGIGPIGFGVSDRVQVGTNVLLFLFRNYNANLKVSLMRINDATLAIGVDVRQFYLDVSQSLTPFFSASPFLAYTTKIDTKTDLHLSGIFSQFSSDEKIEDADVKAFSEGTSLSVGLSYNFSNRTKFLTEAGYDATFDGDRFAGAVLWGWSKFRLKLGLSYFNPKDSENVFITPVIGFWWRFGGEN